MQDIKKNKHDKVKNFSQLTDNQHGVSGVADYTFRDFAQDPSVDTRPAMGAYSDEVVGR